MSGYTGRNRPAPNGRPQGVQISYASQLKEREPSFHTYEHLKGLERGDSALTMLRKAASMVKPIMRKRNWKVQVLAEFLPPEDNLLGLNINKGHKICIRLRYHNHPDLFLPMEQVIDTLLHELSHNVWGAHDANFHRLWDELRHEMETLMRKGYTGEGFLSEGTRLGGGRAPPPHEMRRLARASAEKRQAQNKLTKGSGQRLGGTPLHLQGRDVRQVITNQITRRNTIDKGCASGRPDAVKISDEASNNTFKTQAEEDDANNKAIMEALYDLIEEEEERKLKGAFSAAPTDGGLAWDPTTGLWDPAFEPPPKPSDGRQQQPSESEQMDWAMQGSAREEPRGINLFEQANQPQPNFTSGSGPTPTAEDSRPSPISSSSIWNTSTFSPVSPLSHSASGASSRRHVPGSASTSSFASIMEVPEPNPTRIPRPRAPSEDPVIDLSEPFDPTSQPPNEWTCQICTCINPLQFLACDACGCERPPTVGIGNRPSPRAPSRSTFASTRISTETSSLGWVCNGCGAFMEHRWWTCSSCGKMKDSS